jgi:hypothetical protein
MRRIGWTSIIAAALLLVGLGAAISAGPDDWFDSPQQSIVLDRETAIVTDYSVLSNRLPVRINAASDAGDVFIGVGHAIDVDDYLGYLSVVRVSGFSSFGMSTRTVSEGSLGLPAAPTDLDFWQAKAVGTGSQQVSGNYFNQPVQAVITKLSSGPATVKVSIGTYMPGSFAASLVLAAVGAGLLISKWWPRRQTRPDSSGGTVGEPDLQETAPPATSTSRTAIGLSICATVLSLGGCAVPTLSGLPPREQLTRDPAAGLDLVALAADYDRRNNAAIKASAGPTYSAAEWSAADDGILLGIDRFSTAWSRETKAGPASGTCQTTVKDVYSTSTKHYPLTLVATRTFACGTIDGEPDLSYARFMREHSFSPWKLVADAWLDQDASVPKPHAEPADDSQQQAAVNYATAFANNLSTGSTTEPKLPADLEKARNSQLAKTSWCTSSWSASVIRDGVRTVRTDRGSLAVASILITQRDVAKDTMHWNHPWDRVLRQTGARTELTSDLALVAVIEFGDTPNAVPTILTWNYNDYLPA